MQLAAHLHALCGTRVSLNLPVPWVEIRYPSVSATSIQQLASTVGLSSPDDFLATSVMPRDALLVTLVVSEDGATFVDTHQELGALHMVRPEFCLKGFVPDHSVLHALCYTDKKNKRLIGIFDANKIAGEDISQLSPLKRHRRVFELYHSAARAKWIPSHILYHGVYYQKACQELKMDELHFETDCLLRLPLSHSDLVCDLVSCL